MSKYQTCAKNVLKDVPAIVADVFLVQILQIEPSHSIKQMRCILAFASNLILISWGYVAVQRDVSVKMKQYFVIRMQLIDLHILTSKIIFVKSTILKWMGCVFVLQKNIIKQSHYWILLQICAYANKRQFSIVTLVSVGFAQQAASVIWLDVSNATVPLIELQTGASVLANSHILRIAMAYFVCVWSHTI